MGIAEFASNKLQLSHFDSALESGHASLVYRNMTAFYELAEVRKEYISFRSVRCPTQPSNSVDCAFYMLMNITKVESKNIEPEYEDNDVKKFRDSLFLKLIEKLKAKLMFSDTPEHLRDNSPHSLRVPNPFIETSHHELRSEEKVGDLVINTPDCAPEPKTHQFGEGQEAVEALDIYDQPGAQPDNHVIPARQKTELKANNLKELVNETCPNYRQACFHVEFLSKAIAQG